MAKRLRFFEKDTVAWDSDSKVSFYRTINDLNHTRQALWNGDFGGTPECIKTSNDEAVFAFQKRQGESTVVVILNLSEDKAEVSVPLPDAPLALAMGSGEPGVWAEGTTMDAWGYAVLATEE